MSAPAIKISRPTKLELIKLRKRLALARRYYNILKDRESLLLQTFRETLLKLIEERRRLNKALAEAYQSYYNSVSLHGWKTMEAEAASVKEEVFFKAVYKNILGVWTFEFQPSAKLKPQENLVPELYGLQKARSEIVETLARVSEYEKTLVSIGAEISRLKRVVNMLEKVYIPRLERTIRYLSLKFDEVYREETIRALKVKRMLEGRESSRV
ncbi:MAG: V-type ATP synthase subunit D [Thermogladius sp.]|nr:V-type ATP synthase subunit D [Thermogladius sp.]